MASASEVRADLDAASSRVAFLEAELRESRREAETARAGEASCLHDKDRNLAQQSSEISALHTKVDRLERRVIELAAEKEEEIDRGQDGARWGWDNFRTQLEHLNPGLNYRAFSMRLDWEVVDGVFAPIPSDEVAAGAGESGVSDDPTGGRGGGSDGPAVSPGSNCAPCTVLHRDPVVAIASPPCGHAVIYPDGVPTSPSSDEVNAATIVGGDMVRETGCGTPDSSPRAIPAICELESTFAGAYLFSAPP
ncbi:uncharacterized protein G2W53_008011 [Senna tora]|uniref:Uncharacterized protein n=1 Tax=Senna tora TaxID=362788 RepID=A0A834X7I3_9FABA|nr:uncharacterized protein G2W53_008011 [Senna tora]